MAVPQDQDQHPDIALYVDQMAQMIDLPLPPEYRDSVIENYGRIQPIAQLVLEFPLPPDTPIAPLFQP